MKLAGFSRQRDKAEIFAGEVVGEVGADDSGDDSSAMDAEPIVTVIRGDLNSMRLGATSKEPCVLTAQPKPVTPTNRQADSNHGFVYATPKTMPAGMNELALDRRVDRIIGLSRR